MKKIICIIFLSLTFISCKSQLINNSDYNNESKLLMDKIFSDFNNMSSASTSKEHIDDKILNSPNVNEYKSWEDMIQKSDMILIMARNFNIKTKKDIIDYTKIFTKKEINNMSQQISKIEAKSWSNYLGIVPFEKKEVLVTNRHFFTIPAFTVNYDYAIIYHENRYGGDIRIYQKIYEKWEFVAIAMVWIN